MSVCARRGFPFGTNAEMVICPGFENIHVPFLSNIPVIGPILFRQNVITYFAVLTVPVLWWFLFRTNRGLTLRAAGENPQALDAAGVDAIRVRYMAVLFGGVLCGVGGAAITLTGLNTFYDEITSGRGFIAYAAIVFGKWNPVGAALATFLFGMGDALQLRLQSLNFNVPYYLYNVLPYLLTFIALVFFMGPSRAPAANGKPYRRDKARGRKRVKGAGK